MISIRFCMTSLAFVLLTVHTSASESQGDEGVDDTAGNTGADAAAEEQRPPQYEHDGLVVPAAWADEPVRASLSIEHAAAYVENAAAAWRGSKNCVACHTTGAYLCIRPMLSSSLGPPSGDIRALFVSDLAEREEEAEADLEKTRRGIIPAHVANIAWGLAEWDAEVSGSLSPETERALALMFRLQSDDGSFSNLDCWPPFESSGYQAATVAAMAVATAPGWKDNLTDEATLSAVDRLGSYLRETPAPHPYAEVLLLRAATRWRDLMDNEQRRRIYADIFSRRNEDGGWAMRDFATPEQWGRGNRAEKLQSEPEFASPPSDAHMTALVMITYMDAGMARDDRLVRRGVNWLKSNQRESGRWWTRSLNTDGRHFITYSGSIYALAALHMSGSLTESRPARQPASAATVVGNRNLQASHDRAEPDS